MSLCEDMSFQVFWMSDFPGSITINNEKAGIGKIFAFSSMHYGLQRNKPPL